MMTKSRLKYSASIAVLLLSFMGAKAQAVDVVIANGNTSTGLGLVDGVDSISYADAGGSPINFTFDNVGTFTLGIDTNSIDGDQGVNTSTNQNIVNLIIGDTGGALDLIVSGNVLADGSTAGVSPDIINFNFSGAGSHTVTLNGANNNLGAGSVIDFGNAGDILNINGNITVGAIDFQAVNATVNVADGVTVDGNIDNLAGAAGNLVFDGSGVVTGTIGAGASVSNLTVNNNGTLELQGTTHSITNTTLGGPTGSTLLFTTNGATFTSNIDSDVNGLGVIDIDANTTLSGTIGTAGAANGLADIQIANGQTLTLQANIQSTDVTLEGNATLLLNTNGLNIESANGIDGDTANNGTVQVNANATLDGDLGAVNGIDQLNVSGGSTFNFLGDTLNANAIVLNDSTLQLSSPGTATITSDINSAVTASNLDIDKDTLIIGNIGNIFALDQVTVANGVTLEVEGVTFSTSNVTLEGLSGSTLTLNNGMTFAGGINSDASQQGILNITGDVTIDGDVGTASTLSNVQIENGNTLTLMGSLTSTNVSLDGSTLLLDQNGATLSLGQNIDGSALNGGTLQIMDSATVIGGLGATNGLDVLVDFGAALTYAGTSANANILLDNSIIQFTGVSGVIDGSINALVAGEGLIDVDMDTTFNADIGDTASINELTIADGVEVTLAGATVNIDDLTLESSGSVQFNGAGLTFTGDINSDINNQGAIVVDDMATVIGNIGDAQQIAFLNVNNGDVFEIQGTTVNILATTLNGGTLVLNQGGLNFSGNIEATSLNGGNIQASSDATIIGNIGATNALTSVVVDNATTLNVNSGTFNATNINLDGGTIDFVGAGSTVTANIDGTALNGGTVDFSSNTNLTGDVGGTSAVSAVNVDMGVIVNLDGDINASAIDIDGGLLNIVGPSTITGNVNGTALNGGMLTIDGDTLVVNDIGATNALTTFDVNASNTLTFEGSILNATTSSIDGGLTIDDTVTLGVGNSLDFGNGATITVSGSSVSGTSATTGNAVFIDADANDANVTFSPGSTDIIFTSGPAGRIELVDASNGGSLNLNGTSFNVTDTGILVDVTVDTVTNPDIVSLVVEARSQEEVAVDLGVSSTQAGSLIQASDLINDMNDPGARTALDTIIASGGAPAQSAAEQLTPDIDSISNSAQVSQVSRENFNNVSSRLGAVRTGRSFTNTGLVGRRGLSAGDGVPNDNFWVRGFAQVASQDDRDGISGYDAQSFGFTVGYDESIGLDSRAGIAFGYADTEVDGDGSGSSLTEIDSYQLTLYADYTPGNYYLEGQVGFSFNQTETSSEISFAGLNRTLSGDYNTEQYSASIEAGYAFPSSNTGRFVPYIGAQYFYVGGGTVDLTGAGGFDQTVRIEDLNTFLLSSGARYEFEIPVETGTILPMFHGGVLYDVIGDESQASASFASGGPAFTVDGAEVEELSFDFGTGITFITDDGLSEWSASYAGEVKEDFFAHTGVIKATFKF